MNDLRALQPIGGLRNFWSAQGDDKEKHAWPKRCSAAGLEPRIANFSVLVIDRRRPLMIPELPKRSRRDRERQGMADAGGVGGGLSAAQKKTSGSRSKRNQARNRSDISGGQRLWVASLCESEIRFTTDRAASM